LEKRFDRIGLLQGQGAFQGKLLQFSDACSKGLKAAFGIETQAVVVKLVDTLS